MISGWWYEPSCIWSSSYNIDGCFYRWGRAGSNLSFAHTGQLINSTPSIWESWVMWLMFCSQSLGKSILIFLLLFWESVFVISMFFPIELCLNFNRTLHNLWSNIRILSLMFPMKNIYLFFSFFGRYGSLYATSLLLKLREDGVYMRPLGNVIYLMCGPCTSPEVCRQLLIKLHLRLEDFNRVDEKVVWR